MASTLKPVELSPPPSLLEKFMPRVWSTWFNQLYQRLGMGPLMIQGYDKASIASGAAIMNPKAIEWCSTTTKVSFTSLIWVRDAGAGSEPYLAYAFPTPGPNGVWKRVFDNATIT